MRNWIPYFGYLAIYAWFVICGKLLWWFDFAFLNYRGPSGYLEFCVKVGFYALLSLGMFPVGLAFQAKDRVKADPWRLNDYGLAMFYSTLIVFACLVAGVFPFGIIGYVIHWFSEDAGNNFFRFTTIMRD